MTAPQRSAVRSGQERLDSRAIEIATRALVTVEQHQAECQRREDREHEDRVALRTEVSQLRTELSAQIGALHVRLDSLQGRWFAAALALVGLLLSLVAYLLANGAPWHAIAAVMPG